MRSEVSGAVGLKEMQDKHLNKKFKFKTKFNDPPPPVCSHSGLHQYGSWATFKRDPNGGTFALVVLSKYV